MAEDPDGKTTSAGIPLAVVYEPAGGAPPELGRPGEPPYTRGIHPTMYRGRPWTMRQYAGFGTAAESNQRYKFLLASGQTGLSVAFDLPTQMGRDSDHPLARGEVGRSGVAISSLDDMHVLLDGLPLDRVSTSMTINATAATLLCLYVAVADERGLPRAALSGTIQNDILKEYIARGTYIYPPAPSMRLVADTFAFCRDEVPRWNTISISGYHIREAGSDAVQEVAFTLADGIAYVEAARAARARGRRLRAAAVVLLQRARAPARGGREVPRGAAPVGAHHARALRRARPAVAHAALPRADGGLDADGAAAAQQRRAHDDRGARRRAGRRAVDPHERLRRGAGPAHRGVGARRAAHAADPRARGGRRRRRRSAGRARTRVEALTSELEARAAALIAEIDARGGMVAAIEAGWPQREIERRAFEHQRAVETGARVIVGVNRFGDEPTRAGAPAAPPRSRRSRPRRSSGSRASARRATRRPRRPRRPPSPRRPAATANLVPCILQAVKARATLGEIADALRAVFGEYRPA